MDENSAAELNKNRDAVLKIADELGIPTLDIHNEAFAAHAAPLSLYSPFRLGHHFNPEGHRVAADAIVERLRKKHASVFKGTST